MTVCQLDGCNEPLLRKTSLKRNKYCCDEHAALARKEYQILWRKNNKEKVKEWNKIGNEKYKSNIKFSLVRRKAIKKRTDLWIGIRWEMWKRKHFLKKGISKLT